LERPEPFDPLVRLAEQAQAEQTDHDDDHGSADERNEQLGPNPGRHAADCPDERIVAPAQETEQLGAERRLQ
jgi:hypothetical protein